MAFNIQDFSTNIKRYGTLQSNRYQVIFQPPRSYFQLWNNRFVQELTFRADSVKLPGVNFATFDHRRYGVGPIIKAPTNVQFSEIDISFIETSNQSVFEIFYDWANLVVNYREPTIGPDGPSIERQIFTANYKDDYVSNVMEIQVFNNSGTVYDAGTVYNIDTDPTRERGPVSIIELIDVFPISVSDTALSWSDNNSLIKVNVQFAFTTWRFKRTAQSLS